MKSMVILLSCLCAILSSLLVGFFAAGRYHPPPTQETPDPSSRLAHVSLFPEQGQAVADLLEAISARQEELDRQEQQVREREQRTLQEAVLLSRMREELSAAEAELRAHLEELQAREREMDEEDPANIRKLAEFYARMDPENAARLLGEMEPLRAARILLFLGDRQAGAIMNAAVEQGGDGMDRAVAWSETIRQLRRP